eukprot:4604182-Amphidinium_carterae.1
MATSASAPWSMTPLNLRLHDGGAIAFLIAGAIPPEDGKTRSRWWRADCTAARIPAFSKGREHRWNRKTPVDRPRPANSSQEPGKGVDTH